MLNVIRKRLIHTDLLINQSLGLCQVTLNRPKALNSINIGMFTTLLEEVKKWNTQSQIVLFTGAGDKAFSAGGDIRSLYPKSRTSPEFKSDFFIKEYSCDYAMAKMKPIQVSFYDGIVMGGGAGISIHSPFRIATEKSVFAMPETAIGYFPDVGATFFLPRLIPGLGSYLGLTGARLYGIELVRAGLATHFVKSEHLPKLKESLIECTRNLIKIDDVQKVVDSFSENTEGHIKGLNNIQKFFGRNDSVEELCVNLENAQTEWTRDVLRTLKAMCPLTVKVAFQLMEKGRHLSLREALNLEYRLSQRATRGEDLYEGIRAAVIDKDRNLRWQHRSIFEVPDSLVEEYILSVPDVPIDVEAESNK